MSMHRRFCAGRTVPTSLQGDPEMKDWSNFTSTILTGASRTESCLYIWDVYNISVLTGCFHLKLGPTTWGIPHGSRARPILFCSQSLQKKASAYPNIGQKRLNGAASRMMVHWAYIIASQIHQDHPSDIHRLWVPIYHQKMLYMGTSNRAPKIVEHCSYSNLSETMCSSEENLDLRAYTCNPNYLSAVVVRICFFEINCGVHPKVYTS